MTELRPLAGTPPVPRDRRLVVIVWVFVWIVVWLLAAAVYAIGMLSAGRAYVGAEGQWSRAQKSAVFHLTRYAVARDEAQYEAFTRAIAIPLADRRARLELEKADPDAEVARQALQEGGNHAGDVDGMIGLYDRYHRFGPGRRIAELWAQADLRIDELARLAGRIRAGGPAGAAEVRSQIAAIGRIDAALSPLEDAISANLDAAQRSAQRILVGGLLVLAALQLVAGILLSRRVVAQSERLQRTLRESEAQTRRLIESAPLPLLILRAADQGIVYANDRALQQFGLDMDSVRGRSFAEFHAEEAGRQALAEALGRDGSVRDYEVEMKDMASGRRSWLLLSAQRLRHGGEECLLAALANIDDRKRLQEDMRRRAMHDPLTTLPNRAMFLEALERAVRKAERRETRFSVLFIDLDRFKEVNDTLGHHAGDALLQTVAERLVSAVRQSDLVARLGGDEFVVLIEEPRGPEEVMIVAQKVLTLLERPVLIDWREANVSASIGIASYPDDGEDTETLVKHADAAMYLAKESGRSTFRFYSDEINAMSLQRFDLGRRLAAAVERDELFLQYLPIVDLASGAVRGVEALLRWRDPDSGVAMPDEFLAQAQASGAIIEIGRWVLSRALRDLAGWRAQGLELAVSVNVSARELQEPELVNRVFRELDAHRVPSACLMLEVPESALASDVPAAERNVRGLAGLGIGIALDDFGTGLASLGLVSRFPVRCVKIDRTLIAEAKEKREARAVAEAVAALARALGIAIVAGGVDTEEQRRAAIALGFDAGQGALFGRPLEAARVPRLFDAATTAPG